MVIVQQAMVAFWTVLTKAHVKAALSQLIMHCMKSWSEILLMESLCTMDNVLLLLLASCLDSSSVPLHGMHYRARLTLKVHKIMITWVKMQKMAYM